MTRNVVHLRVAAIVTVTVVVAAWGLTITGQTPARPVVVDADDIGGAVTGPNGPEAGVWVIAETTDLPTRLIKSVVTDDQGRYLVPDLPKATYRVWTRGYGLIDSPKVDAGPGRLVNLTAVAAPDARAAAQYYPAGYWYSLVEPPKASEFPGTGPGGNGISPDIKNQGDFIRNIKSGTCLACHQLGNKATREFPPSLGKFNSSREAWERRLQSGQAGGSMIGIRSWISAILSLGSPVMIVHETSSSSLPSGRQTSHNPAMASSAPPSRLNMCGSFFLPSLFHS